ncbi:MAG: protein kinase [Burkholderiales bacterium]|nr:protein kinase [Burkholderiales bacterium]
MSADYVRRCPTCGAENAPSIMRCVCGALLAGVDLILKQAASPEQASVTQEALPEADTVLCPFEDCGQPNPAGSTNCLYCNRPLNDGAALTSRDQTTSLVNLPQALGKRYRIVKPMPAQGSEAELLLVQEHSGGPARVAKVYRHGIQPKRDVQERIAKIDASHRVEVLESGVSDGYAYELMEFCEHGSLRERLRSGPLAGELLHAVVRELASAIAAVHNAGLVHRDLKPENILMRTEKPLDLVLTDFGISSVLDATQRFTGAARTLPYASPESLSGVIDGKSDYWALGMILLEAGQGKHPFAGLSEAVILHHLTTRSMDTSGVSDRRVRILLRGLLLRDPKTRWGTDEVGRWLANDGSLTEPVEAGAGGQFTAPYHVGKELCHSKEQLAVALARNWRDGAADINNGQLLAWFRDVQKDQNAVRLLLEVRFDKQMHVDAQLLKLILLLAPGIPPVWRGESIELPSILSRANQALKGDADAAHWLDLLYRHRVLEAYADAGNQEAAEIVQRWHAMCDKFDHAWEDGLALIDKNKPASGPDEYANFDQLVYGQTGPNRPATTDMHPRLLALAYDEQWAERLRMRLSAELVKIQTHCPWIGGMGDVQTMNPTSLLVLESLLPEARKAMERQIKADARRRDDDVNVCRELTQEFALIVTAIHSVTDNGMQILLGSDELAAALDRYFDLLAKIRSSGRSDEPWMALKKSVMRAEGLVILIRTQIDALTERQAANAGWLSPQVLVFVLLAAVFAPIFLGPNIVPLTILGGIGLLAWRLLPIYFKIRKIQELARRL